jgi:signal transduction histidine kinase
VSAPITEDDVLLTRSIRRKMTLGLGVLLLTLGLLSIGGISGVSNFRRMVKDLEFSIEAAPRNAKLIDATLDLIGPLTIEPLAEDLEGSRSIAYRRQRQEIEKRLQRVRTIADEHFDRLDSFFAALPGGTLSHEQITHRQREYGVLRNRIDDLIKRCEQTLIDEWENTDHHHVALIWLLSASVELAESIQDLPEPVDTMHGRLREAKRDYRTYLVLLWMTSVSAVSLFLVLSYCTYRVVVTPIRALHRGASRVAAGDFDYRIDLNTNDEISELAVAFNHMTERFQAIAEDLDRQVQQQTRQLVQSAKLAGVGFLAAGVAHEINNPLHAIATAAEGLEYRLVGLLAHADEQDAAIIRDYLQMMQTESSRCRTITEKLLDFARGKDAERNQYDITAIVRDVVSMMKHVGKFRDRHIHFDIHDPHYAHVNGSEIKQVALNIIANAVEATQQGGGVFIDIRETLDFVEVTCRDDGCGMTPEVLENLFEPFYTTKQVGKGTGLGLSISHRIIRDHDGVLEAASEGPGKGSVFRIRLPKKPRVARTAA